MDCGGEGYGLDSSGSLAQDTDMFYAVLYMLMKVQVPQYFLTS